MDFSLPDELTMQLMCREFERSLSAERAHAAVSALSSMHGLADNTPAADISDTPLVDADAFESDNSSCPIAAAENIFDANGSLKPICVAAQPARLTCAPDMPLENAPDMPLAEASDMHLEDAMNMNLEDMSDMQQTPNTAKIRYILLLYLYFNAIMGYNRKYGTQIFDTNRGVGGLRSVDSALGKLNNLS